MTLASVSYLFTGDEFAVLSSLLDCPIPLQLLWDGRDAHLSGALESLQETDIVNRREEGNYLVHPVVSKLLEILSRSEGYTRIEGRDCTDYLFTHHGVALLVIPSGDARWRLMPCRNLCDVWEQLQTLFTGDQCILHLCYQQGINAFGPKDISLQADCKMWEESLNELMSDSKMIGGE